MVLRGRNKIDGHLDAIDCLKVFTNSVQYTKIKYIQYLPNNLQKGAKIMADLQLKITMGDIDVNIQGEGELVYKIFKELREEGLGALHKVHLSSGTGTLKASAEHLSDETKAEGEKASVQTSKPKKKSNQRQPQLIKDLDLSGKGVIKSLKDFVSEKKPATNIERTAVFIYYMQNILNLSEITVDHVFSCYKNIGVRLPQNLPQNLNDTASSRYGFIEVDNGKYTVSILGINLIEHDLPRKE